MRELGRIVDMVSAERAGPVVRAGQEKAAAAWDAARAAAWDAARAAARDAAGDALTPTVANLQRSAIDLFRSMITPEA